MKHFYLNFYRLLFVVLAISLPSLLHAQGRLVKGRVLEANTSAGIPGATVVIKGTTTGTVTDMDGNYQLNASANDVLVYSFVGFKTKEVTVGQQSQIDVSLVSDDEQLDELVVVGYGTQERARVTGAISSVSSKEIDEQPVASVDQALQGRAAGINVVNSGAPGVSPIVRIRGMGSVGNNNPLYVIDGMPAGGINEINPNDIESIQVLKDAAAAAIYGSRAANGVIMVTTKKGVKGKTQVNLDAYYGVQTAWKQLDLLNAEQYRTFAADLLNDDLPDRFNDPAFADVDTDWQDAMFRTAPITDINVTASGGGDNSLFNIGGGYFKQDGIMRGTGFERYSFRANSEFTLGRFKVGETLTIALSDRQNEAYNGGRTQIEHMIKMIPYLPIYNPASLGGFQDSNISDGSDPENPVQLATLRRNLDTNTKILGTAYGSFEIIDGLEYKLLLGLDMNFGFNEQYAPMYGRAAGPGYPVGDAHVYQDATLRHQRQEFISPMISNQLSFERDFDQHRINAVAVVEQQTWTNSTGILAGTSRLSNDIQQPVFFNGSTATIGGDQFEYAILSYLGRVNYDYAGKYLFSASVRRDGSSRFGSNYKWGTFPAASVGWRVSEEPFLRDVRAISEMKLRASYGQVGNDGIGDYRYQAAISTGHDYILGGAAYTGSTIRQLENRDIRWEATTMANLGIDLGFLNNSVRASIEYFHNETEDLLLDVPVAPSVGFDVPPPANVGTVVNKGFELTGGYYKYTGDFQWSLGGNISFVKNELTSLGSGNAIEGAGFLTTGFPVTRTDQGNPIAYYYGWVVDGIFQSTEDVLAAPTQNLPDDMADYDPAIHTAAGDIKFKDLNNDGVIDAGDRTNIGHFLPDFSYGINATANYKNFDLSLFLQGTEGNEILNTNLYHSEGMTRLFNGTTNVLNAWTEDNKNTSVPRAQNGDPNANARISTRMVEDGSYMRLKNLSIGYTMPTNFLGNIGNGFIKRVRVYATAQNLLTFTDYSFYDPEIGIRNDLANQGGRAQTLNSGVDFGQYPQPRTFIGGIQIGF